METSLAILAEIKIKINPYHTDKQQATISAGTMDKKMYIRTRCSTADFLALFPNAKKFPLRSEAVHSKLPLRKKNRFKKTNKIFEKSFQSVENLEEIFGSNWYIVFNGTSVGFVLPPITFRLNSTRIFSHATCLSHELEKSFLVEKSTETTYTSLSITMYRGSLSTWGAWNETRACYDESQWEEEMKGLQENNSAICANRLSHKKIKRNLV